MPILPNSSEALIDLRKLRDYCLDSNHLRGRHKARIFRKALGIGAEESEWLRTAVIAGLRESEAEQLPSEAFGARYRVDMPLSRQEREIVLRTIWIIRTGEDVPRFVTCWPL